MSSLNPDPIAQLTGSVGATGGRQMFSPWMDLSTQYAPQNIRSALYLCEYLFYNNATYREASKRVVNYFVTRVKYSGQAANESKKFQKVMDQDFKVLQRLQEVGMDYMCYGNCFTTIIPPFVRVLQCTGRITENGKTRPCGGEGVIAKMDFKYESETGHFYAYCHKCGKTMRHMVQDYPHKNSKKIRQTRWDPKRITLEYNDITGDCQFWYDIPEHIANKVRRGDPFMISTLPWEVIEAIRRKEKFKFNNDWLFHMKEPSCSGVYLNGWGIPSILSAYKNMFRLQVLLRHDEVLSVDYMVPLRIISPKQGSYQEGNSIVNASMSRWAGNVGDMIRKHRLDGADWNIFPFPVEYQVIGGEGRNFMPKDAIQFEEERVLNARGIPPELYRMSLSLGAAPVALRLFERSWTTLVQGFNDILQWEATTIARHMGSGDYEVTLEPVTLADDLEAKAFRAQLMQGQIISKETALGPLGIDTHAEFEKMMKERAFEQQETQKAEQDMQMQQMAIGGDQQAPGGQGGGQGGGGQGITPMDLDAQADEIARNMLAPQMPEATRRSQLAAIRNTNSTLHAMVLKKMDQLRNMARGQGMAQAMPQVLGQPITDPGAQQQQGGPII